MRTFEEILKEVHEQASKDNCQSWNVICLLAMEQAVKERKQEIIKQLENYTDGLEYQSF